MALASNTVVAEFQPYWTHLKKKQIPLHNFRTYRIDLILSKLICNHSINKRMYCNHHIIIILYTSCCIHWYWFVLLLSKRILLFLGSPHTTLLLVQLETYTCMYISLVLGGVIYDQELRTNYLMWKLKEAWTWREQVPEAAKFKIRRCPRV